MTTRFADTTAFFEWHAGTSQARDRVRELLDPTKSEIVTSEAVEREWKRIICDAASKIDKASEQADLSLLFAELSVGFGREPAQRLRTLAMLAGPTQQVSRAELKLRSDQLLRGDLNTRFAALAASIRRRSSCGLATQQPHADREGWTLKKTCRIREGICDHEARLEGDAARWSAGAATLNEAGQPHKKMGKTAEKMLTDARVRTGKNCYAATGDLFIALDCDPGEELVTTDAVFDILASAMQIVVHRVSTTA